MDSKNNLFATLRAGQATYAPNDNISHVLAGKTIAMLVGPAAIGKSTIMNAAIDIDPRLHRVPSFTTRAPRLNDEPGIYHYIKSDQDLEKLEHDIHTRNVVQYAISPVKDVVYGTYASDYLREYNLKDVWYSAVAEFEKLQFKNKIVVGLVADPADWAIWFRERFALDDPEAMSRLEEAKLCLPWMIERTDIKWLQNKNDDLEETGLKLIDICLGGQGQTNGRELAEAMLAEVLKLEKQYSTAH